jgi:ATP-dependent helicase/nuclease subunit A
MLAGQTDLFAEPAASLTSPPAPALTQALAEAAALAAIPASLPDRDARVRIQRDLEANLLVEAGAGAGKTTEMVNRMVALIRTGRATVDQIAAVTFTRKAAAELRERFQTKLEAELHAADALNDAERKTRVDQALREIDRAYIGTIHSFCARLLRDRALEVGLDPNFHETFAIEQAQLRREFFTTHIERLAAAGDPILAALADVGLRPQQLRDLFEALSEHADVTFPADPVARPEPARARRELESLLEDAVALLPGEEPSGGWDDLQRTIRRLCFYRDIVGWQDDIRFLHALAESLAAVPRATYARWGGPGINSVIKDLEKRFRDYAGPEGTGGHVLRQWWAHRYPIALGFAARAAAAFEAERLRTGALSFQDLLLGAARLLRTSTVARAELGERFRFLLVDEFQDTDPIQAEVLLLLSSAPDDADGAVPDWRIVVPRPGALFVVGDPKQSIYRFRRADMTIYNQVKQRFETFGGVLELVANFRSGPPVEALVNQVFKNRFPGEATAHQAAFAPMRVQQAATEKHRVAWYAVEKTGRRTRREVVAAQDSERVACFIESSVRSGGRKPGDFLVLTRDRKEIMQYARAIEARNLAVQVTGAGVSLEHELLELRVLLSALADPGDPTCTVAALVGLFFGLDYEQLAEHALDRHGRFDFVTVTPAPATEVERALATLHELWSRSREAPADVVIAEIIDRFGLLPFAAAGDLGESRAGALLYVLETVRTAALQGDASLRGALIAIDAALETEEAEAPLEPGRDDVVRLMNLHQAKGLEANVVILACPAGEWNPAPRMHVTRPDVGPAEGRIVVAEKRWRYRDTVLACPLDWPAHEAAERAFDDAERERALYVAATRAREELIVARYEDETQSPWAVFYPWLELGFPQIDLEIRPPPERVRLDRSSEDMAREAEQVLATRQALARASYRADAVTRRVKGIESTDLARAGAAPDAARAGTGRDAETAPDAAAAAAEDADDGLRWGKLVHATLEAAGRGARGEPLRAFVRTLLADEERPRDMPGGEAGVDLLVSEVAKVAQSDIWRRAQASTQLLVEVPFSIALDGETCRAWVPDDPHAGDAPVEVIEGVIDLAFRDAGGWVLVDYKSDREGRHLGEERMARYHAQVNLYAACWSRMTGETVSEKVLLFLADGAAVSWTNDARTATARGEPAAI